MYLCIDNDIPLLCFEKVMGMFRFVLVYFVVINCKHTFFHLLMTSEIRGDIETIFHSPQATCPSPM